MEEAHDVENQVNHQAPSPLTGEGGVRVMERRLAMLPPHPRPLSRKRRGETSD
jgi:hypothetical protein